MFVPLARSVGAGCVGAGGGGGSNKFSSSADNDHVVDNADNGGTVGKAGSWTVVMVAELPADSELLTAPAGLGEADLLTRAARSPPTTAVTCCR